MPAKPTISERLKAAREKSGLSQSQAAKAWEINLRTLQAWEQCAREPQGLALRALESILKEAGV